MITPQKPNGPEVAALYARVSTSKQDTSLDIQQQRAFEYAAANGLHIPEPLRFVESDVSGGTNLADRPQGKLMLNMLPLWKCRHVIITKLDRLGRRIVDIENTIARLERQGITVHITDSKLPQDPIMAKLFRQILGVFAEFEREMITRRIQENVDRNRERGLQTGSTPYGWQAIEIPGATNKQGRPLCRLEQDPVEQGHLARMKTWRQHGWSYHRIAQQLNREGIPTKTRRDRWKSGNVQRVLSSRYATETTPPPAEDVSFEDTWPEEETALKR